MKSMAVAISSMSRSMLNMPHERPLDDSWTCMMRHGCCFWCWLLNEMGKSRERSET